MSTIHTSRRYLFFTVFMGGMTTLAIEFTTSRMLQTVYGTSNLVWANVIGLVLLFLTLGYFLGGRLADRFPTAVVFYRLVSLAGLSSIFFLLLTSLILRQAATALAALNLGAVASSLVGVIIALAVPITLLGGLSPFAIRLGVQEVAEAGKISGQIYAISTLGSLLGTYLPVLLIIPLAGSRLTAVLFGTLLFLCGLFPLFQLRRRTAVGLLLLSLLIIPLSLWLSSGPLKADAQQIFETESAYNYIEVIEEDNCRFLLLNEGQAYHSFFCQNGDQNAVTVWNLGLAAPFLRSDAPPDGRLPPLERLLVVGLGAGTIPAYFLERYPELEVVGIELDPEIVAVGEAFFGFDAQRVEVVVGDGRYALNQRNGRFDLIALDAYKVPYIPWHMTTQEFFTEVQQRLTPEGIVVMNVGRVPGDRRLVEAIVATLETVFPSVHAVDVPGSLNTILFASRQPTDFSQLAQALAQRSPESDLLLHAVLTTAVAQQQPVVAGPTIFTDERAPVETIVDSLVINYFLQEGLRGLPVNQ